jgi:hypothetical protein
MASETRALRPFETFSQTQSLLRDVVKIASADPKKGAALAHQRLALTRDEYLDGDVVLWMGRNNEDHARLVETVDAELRQLYPGLPGVVHLVVSISNKRLKMTDLLLNIPIRSGSDVPMRIELHRSGKGNSRPRPLQTPGDGCEVLVELLVGSDLDRDKLLEERAWRKGSWLARVPIGIVCSSDFSGPRPLPLTAAVREQFEIGQSTVHYCRVISTNESLVNAGSLDDVLEYYVDDVVLAAVTGQPNEPWSQKLQLEWILDAIKTFVLIAMSEPSFDEFDPMSSPGDESVLRAILEKVADGTDAVNVRAAFESLREDPSSFFADLEDSAGLLDLERELLPAGLETSE